MEKQKKKNKKVAQTLLMGGFTIIGAICGIFMGEYLGDMIKNRKSIGEIVFYVVILFASMYAIIFIHTIVHEAGHLLFGILTGYSFSSFRIGNFMILKENEKLKLKKYSVPGTLGQCLMIPPELNEGKYPVVWYNLGGAVMNFLFGTLSLELYFLLTDYQVASIICIMSVVIGYAFAATNGIPMKGFVNNDGSNVLELRKNETARKAFWLQLKVAEQMAKGVRLKDMRGEWFAEPEEKDLNNSLVVTTAVFICNRLVDEKAFEEAEKYISKLLEMDTAMIELHRNLLKMDQAYCSMILGKEKETIEEILDEELKKFMKTMKIFPSVIRVEYAYAYIIEKDAEKIKKLHDQFEKACKKYPYEGEKQMEKELIEQVNTFVESENELC